MERTVGDALGESLLELLLLLLLEPVLALEPAFGWDIVVVVFFESLQIAAYALDLHGLALLGRMVGRWEVAKRRARRKERQEVGRQLVRHCCCVRWELMVDEVGQSP